MMVSRVSIVFYLSMLMLVQAPTAKASAGLRGSQDIAGIKERFNHDNLDDANEFKQGADRKNELDLREATKDLRILPDHTHTPTKGGEENIELGLNSVTDNHQPHRHHEHVHDGDGINAHHPNRKQLQKKQQQIDVISAGQPLKCYPLYSWCFSDYQCCSGWCYGWYGCYPVCKYEYDYCYYGYECCSGYCDAYGRCY